jgi:two-component system copper resistance phosphate regulon response regulator CusR
MRVLVVEDEPEVAEFLLRVLRDATWAVDGVSTVAAAREQMAVVPYDLAVIDVGLPDGNGFALCRALRAARIHTPVLLLTARQSVNDRVRGLDAGADDYLAKPFAVSELLARLRALARRPAAAMSPRLQCDTLTLDPAQRTAHRGDVALTLTAREFALLEFLMRHERQVCSRTRILEAVWDDNFDPVANAVDVLVGRLRRKVDGPGQRPLIRTIRGSGYMLSDAPER